MNGMVLNLPIHLNQNQSLLRREKVSFDIPISHPTVPTGTILTKTAAANSLTSTKPLVSTMTRVKDLLNELPRIDTTNTQPLKEFHRFPKLPIEIRNMVWGHIASVPRDIKLYHRDATFMSPRVVGQSHNPAMVQVCRESRREAKRYYSYVYEDKKPPYYESPAYDMRNRWNKMFYVNFKVDRFVYHEASAKDYFTANDYYSWDDNSSLESSESEDDSEMDIQEYNFKQEDLAEVERVASALKPIGGSSYIYMCSLGAVLEQPHVREFTVIWDNRTEEKGRENVSTDLFRQRRMKIARMNINRALRMSGCFFQVQFQWRSRHVFDLPPCSSEMSACTPSKQTLLQPCDGPPSDTNDHLATDGHLKNMSHDCKENLRGRRG